MAIRIRKIVEEDLSQVTDLFEKEMGQDEVEWLYANKEHREQYNAFVAVNKDDDKILGVIGYEVVKFRIGKQINKGVIPLSWYVSSDHRGMAGVLLLKEVFKLADFAFAIQGSNMAKKVYSIGGLVKADVAFIYRKVVSLKGERANFRNYIMRFFAYLYGSLCFPRFNPDITLQAKGADAINMVRSTNEDICFTNVVEEPQKKWVLDCPKMKGKYYYHIHKGTKLIGDAICFVDQKNCSKRGRIVHVSDLGSSVKTWYSTIKLLTEALKGEGCYNISILAKHQILIKALVKNCFIRNHEKLEIFFPKDNPVILEAEKFGWNISYILSDKSYRGV